jgi:hypothetical protein
MTRVVEEGTLGVANHETGAVAGTLADKVFIPAFRVILWVVNRAQQFSPIDALSTGRSITWWQLLKAFIQIVLLLGGVFALAGILIFNRRELATAQGTQ